MSHGFVRDLGGKFTTFDAPGSPLGTFPSGINLEGSITGFDLDQSLVFHGFVRTPGGKVTTFDGPGASTNPIFYSGTTATDISLAGTVSGCYYDTNSVSHGFVRDRRGTLTTFDVPGAANTGWCYNYNFAEFGLSSAGLGISPTGAITGSYFEPIAGNPFGGIWRGFLRSPVGAFTTFDETSDPSSPCCTWTWGIAINQAGVIAGFANDGFGINHGFVRATDGAVTVLDAPGAGTGYNQGTVANGINFFGWVTGSYIDTAGVRHGFLWTPCAHSGS